MLDSHARLPSLRILVAEDAPANQLVTARILEKHGHAAVIAADGRQALDEWEKDGYDLILMDMQMPELDGLSVASIIRRRESEMGRLRIPIIGLTGSSEPTDRQRCLAAGMDGHLIKPIRPDELVSTIEKLVNHSRSNSSEPLSPATQSDAPFDAALLIDRLEGEIELVRRLIEVYRRDCPEFVERAARALEEKNVGALMFAAHRLHGLMRNVEAARAAAAAQELELAARRSDFAAAFGYLSAVRAEVARLNGAIESFAATL